MNSRLNIWALSWPIYIEYLLRILLGNVSTFVLSRYSSQAVAAVGVSNQLITMVVILFNIVGFGTSILVSQQLGAKNRETAMKVSVVAMTMNFVFGIVVGLLFVIFRKQLLQLINLPEELMQDASHFLFIVGMFSFTQALMATMSAVVRSFGRTKISMVVATAMNVLNIAGCYISIFQPFGIPVLGITGVAVSMVVSQCLAAVSMLIVVFKVLDLGINLKAVIPFPKGILKNIYSIGLPAAGEHLSYNLSQIATTSIVGLMGSQALTTMVYCQTATGFIKILSYSIGTGSQIMIGHQVGAGETGKAYKTCFSNLRLGALMNFGMAMVFALMGKNIIGIFTSDQSVIAIGSVIMVATVMLETGRSFNSVIINSLRGAGDVRFPVIMGVISMWGISVSLSYVLGVQFGWGLLGVWIAFSADEWLRGIIMLFRWKSRAWVNLSFVSNKSEIGAKA